VQANASRENSKPQQQNVDENTTESKPLKSKIDNSFPSM
jgi:hypothetical protein